nr:hypothetical protein [Tanacetum cinerariifolium]
MVNTRIDADLSAAVQNALQTLLPWIRAEIREEFRTSSGPSDAGGYPPPVPKPSDSIDNVANEAVHKELGDSLVRAATTASSLEAEQDSGGGPRCQEAIGDTNGQTRVESSDDKESLGEDTSKQKRRIDAIDVDEEITQVNVQDDAEMFDVNALDGEEVSVARKNEHVVEEVVDAA